MKTTILYGIIALTMGLIVSELVNIHSYPQLVGALGVNPLITGIVGITIAGVAGQAIWLVHERRKSKNS